MKMNLRKFILQKTSSILALSFLCLFISAFFTVDPCLHAAAPEPDQVFQPGFNPNQKASWSQWKPFRFPAGAQQESAEDVPTSLPTKGPGASLSSLEAYKPSFPVNSPHLENPIVTALKIDDLVHELSPIVVDMAVNRSITQDGLPQDMMDSVDDRIQTTQQMYTDIHGVYAQIQGMKQQLQRNYEIFNHSAPTPSLAEQFNAQSAAMADRVAEMHKSLEGMTQQVHIDREIVDGMFDVLGEMTENGQQALTYYDKAAAHVKEVFSLFEDMAKTLKQQDLEGSESVAQTRQYLAALQPYFHGCKPYTKKEMAYVKDVENYLQKSRNHLNIVLKDFEKTNQNLKDIEAYFQKAKVEGVSAETMLPTESTEDICASAETKGLSTLKDCVKSCRNVCRWKEKVDGQDCYECPSGSPDTCWDVGAWPADHPWCNAGGICYEDPMLYCVPFGTTGPNLEPLQCTGCKQRPDMCWQKVGNATTTYTNCKLGCWNGKCEYRGKYQEFEWDGKLEWIHCYECVTPPPPPTCEDLGWGYDWQADCQKDCPAPGQCVETAKKIPGGPPGAPPPAVPGAEGGDDRSSGGSPAGDHPDDERGTTGTTQGDQPQGDDSAGQPRPPTGTPQQPTGGAGKNPPTTDGPTVPAPSGAGEAKPTGSAQPPPEPPVSEPQPPSPPDPASRPTAPDEPPAHPPDNPDISFYRRWLEETKERIKSREDIISSPDEGEVTKDEAGRQLEDMTKEREYLETRVREEEQEELERRRKEEAEKRRREEWERTRPRSTDFGEEMKRKSREWHLLRLREAIDALRSKAQEAKDSLTGRREHIDRLDQEIAELQGELQHFETASKEHGMDEDHAKTQIKIRQDRLNHLRGLRNDLAKKLREAQRQYEEELTKLKHDYERRLWSVDEGARRRAETERMDEYFELLADLKAREQSRTIRHETFDSMAADLETQIKDAELNGDNDKADDLRQKLENLKRGQSEWDAHLDKQITRLKDELWELEFRNGFEGVGPDSPEELVQQLDEYAGLVEQQIADTEKAIGDLEKAATRTAEGSQRLDALKAKMDSLRSALDDLKAKKQDAQGRFQLTDEDRQRIEDTTVIVGQGAMRTDADKSFARLFVESLGEESLHNMRPDVALKKSVAFTWGVAQGVGSAVKGLVELGVGAADLLAESTAINLGFEDGGIFGTDASQTLYGVISTVGGNANLDGLTKAAVAAGKAIDDKINELSRSGDIDWATAEFGGKVAGDVVVADAVIAGAVAKGSKALGLVDDAVDAGRAAGKLDEVADAGRASSGVGSRVDDLTDIKVPDAGDIPDVKVPDVDTPGSGVPGTRTDGVPPRGLDAGSSPRGPPDPDDIKTATGERPAHAPDPDDIKTAPGEPPAPPPAVATPTKELGFVSAESGQPVSLRTGEQLGKGSTSTVYVNADDPSKVIRVTNIGGEVAEAATLDKFGREALEGMGDTDALRVAKRYEGHTVQNTPGSPLNNKVVEVNERMFQGTAKDVLAKQGGQMTSGQAKAFDQATRELNERGLAWLDNHQGNYTFEQLPGEDQWRVVVIDAGGVVPMRGSTLAEKADNARAIQSRVNAPSDKFKETMDIAKNNPKLRDMVAGEEWNNIIQDLGDKIDIETLGVSSPEAVAFRPDGLIKHEEVQNLFKAR
jgi:uncharacterized protein (UPF0335 family)